MARLTAPAAQLRLAAGSQVVISLPGRPSEPAATPELLEHVLRSGAFLSGPIDPNTLLEALGSGPLPTWAAYAAAAGEG